MTTPNRNEVLDKFLIALVGLGEAATFELSPGEQQRVLNAYNSDAFDIRVVAYAKSGRVDIRLVQTANEAPLPDDDGSMIIAQILLC